LELTTSRVITMQSCFPQNGHQTTTSGSWSCLPSGNCANDHSRSIGMISFWHFGHIPFMIHPFQPRRSEKRRHSVRVRSDTVCPDCTVRQAQCRDQVYASCNSANRFWCLALRTTVPTMRGSFARKYLRTVNNKRHG